MKNNLYKSSIMLAICFSAFCFFYINSQEATSINSASTELVSSEINPEQKDEVYFPDLAAVEKISVLVSKIFKVF